MMLLEPKGAKLAGIGIFCSEDALVLADALRRGGVPIVNLDSLGGGEVVLQVPLTYFPRAHRIMSFGPIMATCFTKELISDLYEARALLRSVREAFSYVHCCSNLEHSGRSAIKELSEATNEIWDDIDNLIYSINKTGETLGDVPHSLPLEHSAYEDEGRAV